MEGLNEALMDSFSVPFISGMDVNESWKQFKGIVFRPSSQTSCRVQVEGTMVEQKGYEIDDKEERCPLTGLEKGHSGCVGLFPQGEK